MTRNPKNLAIEFSNSLQARLTHEELQEVVQRNAAETSIGICHSHDFCDANMVLYEVFFQNGMDPALEGGFDLWGGLWDATWNLAKFQEFNITKLQLSLERTRRSD
jgi:hypothetical protein